MEELRNCKTTERIGANLNFQSRIKKQNRVGSGGMTDSSEKRQEIDQESADRNFEKRRIAASEMHVRALLKKSDDRVWNVG
jgi:hypothetical protein